MAASQISLKLCGRIFDDSPTAMPSAPCASSSGNFTGSVIGSLFLPSYDIFHSVVLGLNTTSSANFESLASMYRGAAALEPVRMFPQLPCVSTSSSFCPNCTRASPMLASPCGWNCMVCPTMLATLLYLPSSMRFIECRMRRCTGFSPSSMCGTALSRIT